MKTFVENQRVWVAQRFQSTGEAEWFPGRFQESHSGVHWAHVDITLDAFPDSHILTEEEYAAMTLAK